MEFASALAITQTQAVVFGLLTFPVTLWVIWTDLVSMKIRNEAVLAMLAIFVLAGIFVLPVSEYAWRYVHLIVALIICFTLTVAVGMGAGDAKYISAVAPFVALRDLDVVFMIYVVWSVLLIVGMIIARRSETLRQNHPDWIWLAKDRKGHVPFGLVLAPTVTTYFVLGILLE